MRIIPRRALPWALALAGLPLLSGCVYLRLLKVKNQLADFDKNFLVGGSPSWFVEFRNPPLYSKDAVFLVGAPPLAVTPGRLGRTLSYSFQMVRTATAPPTALETLSLDLLVRGGMLRRIEVPERFLLYFSRRVLEECLRQAKDSRVEEFRRTVVAAIRLSPEALVELPSLSRTTLLLGEPLSTEVEEGGSTVLTYRYTIEGDRKGVPLFARLTFSEKGELDRVVIRWDTSTVDGTFLRE